MELALAMPQFPHCGEGCCCAGSGDCTLNLNPWDAAAPGPGEPLSPLPPPNPWGRHRRGGSDSSGSRCGHHQPSGPRKSPDPSTPRASLGIPRSVHVCAHACARRRCAGCKSSSVSTPVGAGWPWRGHILSTPSPFPPRSGFSLPFPRSDRPRAGGKDPRPSIPVHPRAVMFGHRSTDCWTLSSWPPNSDFIDRWGHLSASSPPAPLDRLQLAKIRSR